MPKAFHVGKRYVPVYELSDDDDWFQGYSLKDLIAQALES
jgi:hypothetical protein